MKTPRNGGGNFLGGWRAAALLAMLLSLLFWRSFLPGFVHFSNDGPLGMQHFTADHVPEAFTGMWGDLNDIGTGAVWSLNSSTFLNMVIGPVNYSKFLVPIALFILGLGVWSFFRCLKFTPVAALCGMLAMTLSTGFFAGACWGVASIEIALGFDFFALALVVANNLETKPLVRWVRLMLAGLCIGVNVMEGADIGVLCSVMVAGFIFFKSILEAGDTLTRMARGIGQVALVAAFAGFMAINTVVALLGTPGISDGSKSSETEQQHWDWATQWSLPKRETLGIAVPGLFGYRSDTPKDMEPMLRDKFNGGLYWGGIGRDPSIDRFFDAGGQDAPADHMRFGYAGYYCGLLVVFVGLWAIAQSFRRQNSVFNQKEKYYIWFWTFVMGASLLVAWGRFAPWFYGALYHLPHFRDIRNPIKFLIFFSWALAVLFAYGINAISRRNLEIKPEKSRKLAVTANKWDAFDRKWTLGSVGVLAASIVGWLIYSQKVDSLVRYIQKVGYGDENFAREIAAFSIGQLAWFLVLLAAAIALFGLITSDYFSGRRAKVGALLLVGFMIFDMGRADLPFIIHWDYKQKYEVGSLNPVVDFLRDKTYEHRVAGLPFESQQPLRGYDSLFGGSGIYRIEWAQHHFLYYDIQSLDVIQMPRMAGDLMAYQMALAPHGTPDSFPLVTRKWELTNTRYLLGAASLLDPLNQQLDPGRHRFHIALRFDIVLKPGILQPSQPIRLEEFTAVTNNDGDLALFDFTGALPRAKLYSNWLVNTNDEATLKTLADLNFDPAKSVLVSTPQKDLPSISTNKNTGTVEYKKYSSKHIIFNANAVTPSVMLFNDKYDPGWRVTVDGQRAPLLRCNFIMRGIYLQPGQHTVDFYYSQPNPLFFVSLAAISTGILLGICIFIATRKNETRE